MQAIGNPVLACTATRGSWHLSAAERPHTLYVIDALLKLSSSSHPANANQQLCDSSNHLMHAVPLVLHGDMGSLQ
jgi:hypothetical protein